MIERLRTLSPLLRFVVYVVGALLFFFLAVGVGALAAFVLNRPFDVAPAVSVGESSPGSTTLESTVRESENTAIKPSGDSDSSSDKPYEASFVHRATDGNSRGDYTYISDPSIDGKPNAVVLASAVSDRAGDGAAYGHNTGVWYEGGAGQWAIFNQDLAAVPAGATFKVVVPKASARFVHYAQRSNTSGHYTYLDNRLTNGQPDVVLSVTQNWNPGGGSGVYNDHPVGTQYDAKLEEWAIYNRDAEPMPRGAAFNVSVSSGAN
jgi:cytoskeletal protein RodZ